MNGDDDLNYPVKTSAVASRIFESIHKKGGGTVTEIANRLNISTSSAHNHLITLEKLGYLNRKNGEFHISFKLFEMGMVLRRELDLDEKVPPILRDLAESTGGVTRLYIRDDVYWVVIYLEMGDRSVITGAEIGDRIPPHWSASGKAMLADLPISEAKKIVSEHGFTEFTDNTITDMETLVKELQKIQQEGVAYENEQVVSGLSSVGCSINVDAEPTIGVSVAIPAQTLAGEIHESDISNHVKRAANEIELSLKYN